MEEHEIKARALVMSFLLVVGDMDKAKKCANISVKETISACEYNNVESYNTDWWNKVLSAINLI